MVSEVSRNWSSVLRHFALIYKVIKNSNQNTLIEQSVTLIEP